MTKELLEYIAHSLQKNKNKAEIKKALLEVGWNESVIDDALGQCGNTVAPAKINTLQDQIQSREKNIADKEIKTDPNPLPINQALNQGNQEKASHPIFNLKNKWIKYGVLTLIILIAVLGGYWQMSKNDRKLSDILSLHPTAKIYYLEADRSDIYGINPDSTFTLYSSPDTTIAGLKKSLNIQPSIDFDLKAKSDNQGLFPSLLRNLAILYGNILPPVKAQNDNYQPSKDSAKKFTIIPKSSLEKNKVYRISISDPESASTSPVNSWAFQVKAPFGVISSVPSNKSNSVPTDTAIEITFNRENFVDLEKFVSIEPPVEGRWETHGRRIVFLPKKLETAKIYTITVKKGLKSADNDEAVENDYAVNFETAGSEANRDEFFNFADDFNEFLPDKKTVLEVNKSNGKKPLNISAHIYRLKDAKEFIDSYLKSRDWQYDWTYFQRKNWRYQPDPKEKISSFNPIFTEAGYQTFMELPDIKTAGYYLVEVDMNKDKYFAWLQISPLAHYFSFSYDQSLLWLFDFTKREPIDNASATYYNLDTQDQALGRTEKNGLAHFSTPAGMQNKGSWDNYPNLLKVDAQGYLSKVIKISNGQKADKGERYWGYISTDRYTYQMNDKIKFWGVAKGRDADLRQKKVKVGIYGGIYSRYDNNNEKIPIDEQEVLVSPFDTITGSIAVSGLAPGTYAIKAMFEKDTIFMTNIEVLTYAKPAYQIIAAPSRENVFAGNKINFHIKAAFFDGTPVSDLKLKYSAYYDQEIKGEIQLNEAGEGDLPYLPPYSEKINYPNNIDFTFSPVQAEEGNIFVSSGITVYGAKYYLNADSKNTGPNNFKFSARVNEINLDKNNSNSDPEEMIGAPVVNSAILAKIIKTTYVKKEDGEYMDPIEKIVKKIYRYDLQEETISQIKGNTDKNGEWSFDWKKPVDDTDSSYRVTFAGQDEAGRKFENTAYVDTFNMVSSWKNFAVSLSLNNNDYEARYAPGEAVNLNLHILQGQRPTSSPILFYRYQNSISQAVISQDMAFSEKFNDDFAPSVQYQAVILGPYGFEESNTVSALIDKKVKTLNIDIKTNHDIYKPRDKAQIDLKVTDQNQHPVSAEVNLSVVDESLFHILPNSYQNNIVDALYQSIYNNPITGASQYALIKNEGAEGGGCFTAGTPIAMSDRTYRYIEDIRVGDGIMAMNEVDKIQVPAIVQGISTHLVNGYLIINGKMQVTPEHRIYINGRWDYAGHARIGDILISTDGQPVTIKDIKEIKSGLVPVFNLVVSKYHDYFAANFLVHNAEKGAGSRLNFVDTPLYDNLTTDKNGQARADFEMPDNITAWRATAIAYAPDGILAGSNYALLKSSLPYFVDAVLPDYLLAGDEPTLKVRTFGSNFKKGEETVYQINSEELKLKETKTTKDPVIYIPIGKIPAGPAALQIESSQKDNKDSFIKKISAAKSYFSHITSSDYEVNVALHQVKGSPQGITHLIFANNSNGKYYPYLKDLSESEGLAANVISARFLSNKLLHQYYGEPEPAEKLNLADYQSNYGVSLLPYSDENLELTAELADLAPEYLAQEKTKDYLYSALSDKKADLERSSLAVYGLASMNEPVLDRINLLEKQKDITLYERINLALARVNLGDTEIARNNFLNDIRPNMDISDGKIRINKTEAKTKDIYLIKQFSILASKLNQYELADSYFAASSDLESDDYSARILDDLIFFKSQLSALSDHNTQAGCLVKVKQKEIKIDLSTEPIFTLDLTNDEIDQLNFSDISSSIKLTSVYYSEVDPAQLSLAPNLKIEKQYLVNGQGVSSFKDGDQITVRFKTDFPPDAPNGFYQIVDHLPAGLKPAIQIYQPNLPAQETCDLIWYPANIIGNTVYLEVYKGFAKTDKCQNRSLNYFARVAGSGRYQAEPVLFQSLDKAKYLNILRQDGVEIK